MPPCHAVRCNSELGKRKTTICSLLFSAQSTIQYIHDNGPEIHY